MGKRVNIDAIFGIICVSILDDGFESGVAFISCNVIERDEIEPSA